MDRAFNSIKSTFKQREVTIKAAITKQLSESIKEFQLVGVITEAAPVADDLNAETSLCQVVEAMFLHGLKDTFVYRVRKALADVDDCPQPSFWSPIMVISHRDILDNIEHKLSNIKSEVGQCRAWIRLALNDCLLSSYLAVLQQDSSALKPYYEWYAYLRDADALEVARRLIEGVEALPTEKRVSLPTNSSLLNTWAVPSLLLAGVWAPTMKSCPVGAAIDVAQSLPHARSIDPERSSFTSLLSANSVRSTTNYTEDEALRIILANGSAPQEHHNTQQQQQYSNNNSAKSSPVKTPAPDKAKVVASTAVEVNAQSENTGLVEDVEDVGDIVEAVESEEQMEQSMEHSYKDIISDVMGDKGSIVGSPDLSEMVKELQLNVTTVTNLSTDEGLSDESSTLSDPGLSSAQAPPNHEDHVGRIALEPGLDRQRYRCAGCAQPLLGVVGGAGDAAAQARVCAFTGAYYCADCMAEQRSAIPARVLHNWDFKEYPVSLTSLNYIDETRHRPTINLASVNPLLYTAVPDMARQLELRTQLAHLRAYLHTCTCVAAELAQRDGAECAALDRVHLYSFQDLLEIHNGTRTAELENAVAVGREHVLTCKLCSQRGFLCEICKDSKPIYPFDLSSVFRCDNCNSISHNNCLNASNPCPKCIRKKKFQEPVRLT